ncbi:MAG: site-specific integrase [Bacteroidales bacterium]|nr:site-specific integrase [Bacteroidales bacterium]
MAKIKVKFRTSTKERHEGTIYYQIIHNRATRQIKTDYRLLAREWNEHESTVIITGGDRYRHIQSIKEHIDEEIGQLQSVIKHFEEKESKYTADEIVSAFHKYNDGQSLFKFMQEIIDRLQQMGKQRTCETYRTTLRSFMQFRNNKDIQLNNINSDIIQKYESYLQLKGLSKNSTSFYMRILRAVYNRAVENELTINRTPFKHVYTGIDKTIKRAIPLKSVKQIKELNLSQQPALEFARDIFLFCFYTRGMSFIDIAYLRKKDLTNGTLSYRRRKTGQQLLIRWENCMQEIVEKYNNSQSQYMLPIIKSINKDERMQYKNAICLINRKLKIIGKMVNLQLPLTMYTARHSWANAAKSKNIPISVISEAMGHDSESTTQIYLSSLDTSIVDRANNIIIREVL